MDAALSNWFKETFIEMLEYRFGVFEASTDLTRQIKEWRCFGCSAIGSTEYPIWGTPKFIHEDGCRYLELMAELGNRNV
jgi:hypothetical protein